MSVRYLYFLCVVFISIYSESSQLQFKLLSDDDIVVHNQTDKTVYLSIYNLGKKAHPSGFPGAGVRKLPSRLDSQLWTILTKPERKKISRFKHQEQKLVVSLCSTLLGYTMNREGLECFPTISLSGFFSKRKTHFYVTADLLASQQFGRLMIDNYPDNNMGGGCYQRLNDAIERARDSL